MTNMWKRKQSILLPAVTTGADLGKFLTDASTGNSINNWR